MASGLRAKLRAMSPITAPQPQQIRQGGLAYYVERRDLEEGILSLSGVGLRRIGWSGRPFDSKKCLFLDTETTGLSGGAGTVAFLVGVGFIQEDAFVIEQYLMKDYGSEPELIDRLADRMDQFDYVCTFNGKTFDMPLLEARFTMCRMRHRWRELDNLDLLQPARRTWKLRLGSCRLCNIEDKILGSGRQEDLPGSEIPERYFQFLKTGDMTLLEDIVKHNRQDIATLATLLVRLCEIYDAPETLTERKDQFSVGKALERQGEWGTAKRLYQASAVPPPSGTIAALTQESLAAQANWRLYLIERKNGSTERMRDVLEQMLTRNQMPCQVLVELAKLSEHREKNCARALKYAREARRICNQDEESALDKRILRLEHKLDKQRLGG